MGELGSGDASNASGRKIYLADFGLSR